MVSVHGVNVASDSASNLELSIHFTSANYSSLRFNIFCTGVIIWFNFLRFLPVSSLFIHPVSAVSILQGPNYWVVFGC